LIVQEMDTASAP